MAQDYYPHPILEDKHLDRTLYRGRGRPRKSDYSTLRVIQRKLNNLISNITESGGSSVI